MVLVAVSLAYVVVPVDVSLVYGVVLVDVSLVDAAFAVAFFALLETSTFWNNALSTPTLNDDQIMTPVQSKPKGVLVCH
eukprot:scaffold1321_cov154-Skeletonema_menzelii.AAC.4